MSDIMIDLETLGTSHDAAVIAIGACEFDIRTGDIISEFYARINLGDAVRQGTVDGSTIQWWLKQSKEAREEVSKDCSILLKEALVRLSDIIGSKDKVWGNGATFDITILESHYAKLGFGAPWNHWDVQDVRTILRVVKDKYPDFDKGSFSEGAVAHHALDDAIFQAKYVSAAHKLLTSND